MTTIAPPPALTPTRTPAPPAQPRVVAVLVLDATAADPGRIDAALHDLAGQDRPPDALVVVPTDAAPQDALERVLSDERLRRVVADLAVLEPGPPGEGVVAAFVRATSGDRAGATIGATPGAGADGAAPAIAAPAPAAPAPAAPASEAPAIEEPATEEPATEEPAAGASATAAAATGPATTSSAATTWWWFLTPACAPLPGALAALLGGARSSRTAGIVGPKLLDWDDPRRLVEMGQQVTRAGRRIDSPAHGEPDQGQYDERTDVLAVALPGMIVRGDVLAELHGLDPDLGEAGAGLDLGWRAQLAGHRVVVAPSARVRLALPGGVVHPSVEAGRRLRGDGSIPGGSVSDAGHDTRHDAGHETGTDPDGDLEATDREQSDVGSSTPRWLVARRGAMRRAARRVALTQCSWWVLPFLGAWVVVSSVVSAVALLLLKRPVHAWVELGDLGAVTHPVSGLRSRWRGRRTRRVRRSHLAPVFVGTGASIAHTWDALQDAVTLERSRRSPAGPASAEATETGPVSEEAEDLTVLPASLPQRVATHPGLLAVLLSALAAAVGFRGVLGAGLLDARGAGLAGGELLPVTTTSSGLWHLWRDSWHGAGLGTGQDTPPGVGVLAGLSWLVEHLPYVAQGRSPASVTIAWLLLAAMPLSALTAYLAGRVVTRRQWLRGLLALAWGTSPVLAAAVAGGRVTAALAHVLLPLVVAGFASAATRRGSWTSVFATALATALVGALVPLDLAVSTLAGLGLTLTARRARVRVKGLVLTVLPVALLGPWVLQVVDDPRVLLSGAGLLDLGVTPPPPADPWLVALGFAQGGVGLLHALLLAPLVLVAVAGLARRPRAGRTGAVTTLAVLALVGLAAALVAPRLVLGAALDGQGSPVAATLWAGVGTDLYGVGLLAVVLAAWRVVPTPRDRRDLRALVAVAAAVVVAAGVVGVGGLAVRSGVTSLAIGRDGLPAVAVDQAEGPDASRVLVIGAEAVGVSYSVVGNEPGVPQRDLVAVPARSGAPAAPLAAPATDPGVGDVVGGLASGTIDDVTGPGIGSLLADVGVGFVSLRSDPSGSLARTLDAAPGLARLGTTDGQTLWRVQPRDATPGVAGTTGAGALPVPPSRVRLTTAQGNPLAVVPVSGPHAAADTTLPAGAPGRRLVVAESPQWARAAVVRLDDRVLSPVAGIALPTYEVPSGGGHLVIDLPPAHERWFLAQLVLLVVVLFLAVPFGTRRSRSLA